MTQIFAPALAVTFVRIKSDFPRCWSSLGDIQSVTLARRGAPVDR